MSSCFSSLSFLSVEDKVWRHSYHLLYDRVLPEVLAPSSCLLEIGYGCGMSYGQGTSARLWAELYPEAQIWWTTMRSVLGSCALYSMTFSWIVMLSNWMFGTGHGVTEFLRRADSCLKACDCDKNEHETNLYGRLGRDLNLQRPSSHLCT